MTGWQFFSKPDRYCALCGDLRCSVTERLIPRAPAFMRGVTALFISDVHALPTTTDAAMTALAAKAAALRPDLLLLGGDYSDQPGPTERLFERLAAIPAPLGRFAVDEVSGEKTVSRFFADREAAIRCLQAAGPGAGMRETTLEDVFLERLGRHLEKK